MQRSGQIRFLCETAFELSPKQWRQTGYLYSLVLYPLLTLLPGTFLPLGISPSWRDLRPYLGMQQDMKWQSYSLGMVNKQPSEVAPCKNKKGCCSVSLGLSLTVVTVHADTSWSHQAVLVTPVRLAPFCAKTYNKQHAVHLLLGNTLASGSKHLSMWVMV